MDQGPTEVGIKRKIFRGTSNDIMAVVPTIIYRDPTAMVEWLCGAFGFRRHLIAKGENGEVKHAELTFGESMINVISVQHSPFEKLVVQPDQIGGAETQTCYLIVADVEAHHARAKANNAEIIFDVNFEKGGRGYACKDPEGHLWMFGTYNPRQGLAPTSSTGPGQQCSSAGPGGQAWSSSGPGQALSISDPRQARSGGSPGQARRSKTYALLPLLLSVLLLASTTVALWSYNEMRRQTLLLDRVTGLTGALPERIGRLAQQGNAEAAAEQDAKTLAAKLTEVQAAKESAEQSSKDLAAQLARERDARERAVQRGKETQELLAQELRTKEALSRVAQQTKDQLGHERAAKEAAERLAKEATDQLDQLRLAKAAATERCEPERTSRTFAEQLARERNARAVAELAANELRNKLASVGPDPQERIAELRNRVEVERRANGVAERAVKDVKLQLAQERYSRDSAERALRQNEQKVAAYQPASCWSCPSAMPCERP
ncbi:MAG: VOC family protein [Hyphomicrobiaceae bacterium]